MEDVLVHGSEVSGEYTDVTKSCWSRDEVQALVTLWANENVQDQLLSNVRNETVFTILAARLESLGFSKTPKRCREKIKKLKQEYKKIKDRKCTNHHGGIWFAIMDDVLNYQPDTLDSRMGDSTSLTPSMSTQATSLIDMEDNGKQRASWSPDEVVAFVRLWADQSVQEQLQSAVRNEKVFMKLSSELASLGFSKAPNRCREKIKKLKQEYKRITTMGGPNRRERRWFAIMDAVLSHQPGNGVHKVYNSATETLELIQPPSPSAFGLDHQDKCPSWSFADSQCIAGPRPAMPGFGSANSAAVGLESCLKEPILVPDCTGAVRERSSWSPDEVQDLLTLWADGSVQEKLLSTYRNESIFAKLCSELTLKGYDKTPNQCRQKIKKLKQEYKKIKDLGSSVHHKSRWFLIMDEVFSQQQDMILSEEMDTVQTSLGSSQPNSYMKHDSSEKSLSSWSPNEGPNVAIDQSATKSLDDGPLESADCSDKTQSIWAPDEVQIFLTLWADQSVQDQLLYTVRNTKVFTYLSIELASLGFNKTANQCRLKVKKLKQEYKKLKEIKGSKQRQSRWFAIMDQVLGQGTETEDSTTTPSESSVFALPEEDDRYCSSWSPNETQVLLTLWSDENIQEQLLSTVRNERVYAQLSSELASMGFHKTANQCRFKMKKLKQDYKKTLKQNGPKQRVSRWFTIMDGVLGHRPETDVASNVMDSATNLCASLPQEVEHFAPDFNFSTMCLLVPPIRLMTAFMWHVTQHRSIVHYERVEELVRLLTDLIPELLTSNQRIQLILGLRARLVLELCRGKGTADPVLIQPHLNMIFTLTKDFKREEDDVELECLKSNFVEMVQTILKDQSEKDIFFQELFPVYYGPRYDTALQTLVWELISRLDKLLPIPDVKKTGAWLSAAPSILDECGQMVFQPDQLKTLLEYHHRQGNLKCSNASSYAGDTILSTLSLHPYSREQASIIASDLNDLCRDNCVSYGSEQLLHGVKKDRPSDDSSEDKATAEGLSEEEWVEEHSSERNDKCLGLKQQLQKCQSPIKITGLRCQRSSRVHTCSLCPYSSNKMGLLQHIRKEHLQKASSDLGIEEPQQSRTVRLIAGITSRVYSCTRCCKVFKKLSLLNRHIGTHTLPFHCNQCEKRYSCKELLTKHQRVHTGERPFQCSHCGRGFMCSSTLKMHVRTHTGERRYKCHICGKTSIQHLARHMLMHKGEKNYLCTECGKAFLSSGELRLHTRYHTGERPYTCKHCGKGFIAKCHLTIHMRSHTGERPYLCSLCTKRFPTSNLLKRHMFVHNDRKPFQCFKCGKGFTQGHAMKTHLKTHK